jgi:hypothetical protein
VLDSSTKISPQSKENSAPRPPAHIIDSSTTIACNMSDTYSEAEKRIEQALDEMRALESTPVIADFARQYNVPYNRLYRRFRGTPSKSDRFSVSRRFLDVEEKAMCRYSDRLDKLGLPAQRELLRGTADYIPTKHNHDNEFNHVPTLSLCPTHQLYTTASISLASAMHVQF